MLSRWNWVMTRQNAIQLCPDTSHSSRATSIHIREYWQRHKTQTNKKLDSMTCLPRWWWNSSKKRWRENQPEHTTAWPECNANGHNKAFHTHAPQVCCKSPSLTSVTWHGIIIIIIITSWVCSAMTYHRRCVIWTWQAAADLSLYLATSYLHQPTRYTFLTTRHIRIMQHMPRCIRPSITRWHSSLDHNGGMHHCKDPVSPTVVEVHAYVTQWSTHGTWNPTLAPE